MNFSFSIISSTLWNKDIKGSLSEEHKVTQKTLKEYTIFKSILCFPNPRNNLYSPNFLCSLLSPSKSPKFSSFPFPGTTWALQPMWPSIPHISCNPHFAFWSPQVQRTWNSCSGCAAQTSSSAPSMQWGGLVFFLPKHNWCLLALVGHWLHSPFPELCWM